MCGIIAYTGHRAASSILVDGLRRLEYRGYDSAGIAVRGDDGNVRILRAEGKLRALEARLREAEPQGRVGIGHTRWATHGPPTETNAHPHRFRKVCVVHNGIIENHLDLKAALRQDGHEFASDTDTEIFAHLVHRTAERHPDLPLAEIVRRALDGVRGTWALCVLHDDHPGEVVGARHGAPLLVGLGEDGNGAGPENFLASDVAALLEHTRTVVDLEDGDVVSVRPDAFTVFDAGGAAVERPSRRVTWSPMAAEKQGFKHFMLKEIHEQPQAIADTLLGRILMEQADVHLPEVPEKVAACGRVLIVACGTSFHAGLALRYLVEDLVGIPAYAEIASEFRYRNPVIVPGDVVVAISQSGETADTLAAVAEAKRRGAACVAVCNVVGSSLARTADAVVYTHAGPEISVASTKAFTTQLAALTLFALYLGRRRGTLSPERALEILEALRATPEAIGRVLAQEPAIRAIARRYVAATNMLYLGRGLGYPVALEGALKLKEISYIHAEGYASGEMKHGPIALVDPSLPVVAVALSGPGYRKVVANLEEVRARGGRIVALASPGDRDIADLADDVIVVPDVHPAVAPIVATVPLQLLAYHVADAKGTDVDQPRNLAKSVTVE
ncbi:MAG: glutamine--fructose-6-phosphate transaminase (isomerizing) [Deltaproteobacteria bacterium]|nr:MAG: glutamine--fructose-6-phosphate transaminase (isomerizing) [Deltaproteobacteria bacterium]